MKSYPPMLVRVDGPRVVMPVCGKGYPVIGVIEPDSNEFFPVLDIPIMSDDRWNQLAKAMNMPQ